MDNRTQLIIEWQRLMSDGRTCPRCGSTEEEVNKAVDLLRQSLAHLDVGVVLEKIELSDEQFKKEPLQSNAIWINDRLLEDWLGGQADQSPCCDVCGPKECRTMIMGDDVYEVIPAEMVVKAGLLAAAQIRGGETSGRAPSKECCPK